MKAHPETHPVKSIKMHLRIKSRVRIRYLGNDRPARPLGTWVLSTGIFEKCQPVELKLRDNRVTHGITWLHPNPMILEPHVPDSSMVNGEAICAKQTATKIDGPTNTRIRSWKSPNYMASKKKDSCHRQWKNICRPGESE